MQCTHEHNDKIIVINRNILTSTSLMRMHFDSRTNNIPSTEHREQPTRRGLLLWVLLIWGGGVASSWICATKPFVLALLLWTTAQWIPFNCDLQTTFQTTAWHIWEDHYFVSGDDLLLNTTLEIPVLDVSQPLTRQDIQELLGDDEQQWRSKPLYLKNLWTHQQLHHNQSRRLSVENLLQEHLEIPYFRDATLSHNLVPDARASLGKILKNMTTKGMPHKIATQLLLEEYPELLSEIIPPPLHDPSSFPEGIIEMLFGRYFEPHYLRRSLGGLFPPMTTIPIFISSSGKTKHSQSTTNEQQQQQQQRTTLHTRTDLHCEPIANVAIQLEGSKRWTLISPSHMFQLRPSVSPDGRAYFASQLENVTQHTRTIPRYTVTTHAGDALWIPPWTWHQVDYVQDHDGDNHHKNDADTTHHSSSTTTMLPISIGASLFHFRPWDFVQNNPLLALLVIPNLVKELLGINTQ